MGRGKINKKKKEKGREQRSQRIQRKGKREYGKERRRPIRINVIR